MSFQKSRADDYLERAFPDREAFRAWLEANHDRASGLWLVYFKVGSSKPSIGYGEAVEEALCFGWIDSKVRTIDALRYRQVFTPRKAGSVWSALNKERVARLQAAKRIAPAGQAAIDRAHKDGSWSFLDSIDRLELPADLERALRAETTAWSSYQQFPDGVKKQILYWVKTAKRPETRARRIERVVVKAARGEAAR